MTKLLYLIPVHILIWFLVVLPAMVAGLVLVPIGYYYRIRKLDSYYDRLPDWAFPWSNIEDGIYGDPPNISKNKLAGINPFGFWAVYKWLVFRNPVHNLTHILLARTAQPESLNTKEYSDNPGLPVGDYSSGGYLVTTALDIRNRAMFEYYLVYPYTIFGRKLCVRLRIGYKFGFYTNKFVKGAKSNTAPFVFSFSPIHPYIGK